MIVVKKEGNLITIKGHANYSDGEDIVCASVSSIMYTTVNACFKLNDTSIEYKDNGNTVSIKVLSEDKYTASLIRNMISLYLELSSKYPNNIKVESEE